MTETRPHWSRIFFNVTLDGFARGGGLDRPHGCGAGSRGFRQNPVMNGEQRKLQAVRDPDLVINIAQIIFYHLFGSP